LGTGLDRRQIPGGGGNAGGEEAGGPCPVCGAGGLGHQKNLVIQPLGGVQRTRDAGHGRDGGRVRAVKRTN